MRKLPKAGSRYSHFVTLIPDPADKRPFCRPHAAESERYLQEHGARLRTQGCPPKKLLLISGDNAQLPPAPPRAVPPIFGLISSQPGITRTAS